WWRYLGWLAINVLAAFAVGWFTTPAGGVATLLAIPTLPLVLLWHYRRSAKAQPAAVVTNGPQMVYPGGITTKQMVVLPTLGAAAVALIAALAVRLGPLAAASAATLPLGMSPAFVAILAGIGTGVNAFALILFVAV